MRSSGEVRISASTKHIAAFENNTGRAQQDPLEERTHMHKPFSPFSCLTPDNSCSTQRSVLSTASSAAAGEQVCVYLIEFSRMFIKSDINHHIIEVTHLSLFSGASNRNKHPSLSTHHLCYQRLLAFKEETENTLWLLSWY